MKQWANKQTGFTIVELLIVVVVIAILAAITIVAYNGIQNRTYDTAVQNDLRQMAKKFETAKVDSPTNMYPANATEVEAVGVSATKSAYKSDVELNFTMCVSAANDQFSIAARSRSGNTYVINSSGVLSNPAITNIDNCGASGLTRIVSAWWLSGAGGWRSWIKG